MLDKNKLKQVLNESYNKTKKIGNVKDIKEIKKIDLNNDKYVQPQIKKNNILDKLKNIVDEVYFQQAEKINKSGKSIKFAGYIFKNKNNNGYIVNNLDKLAVKIDKNYDIKEVSKLDDFIKSMSTNDIEKDNRNENKKDKVKEKTEIKNKENENKDFTEQLQNNKFKVRKIINRFKQSISKERIIDFVKIPQKDAVSINGYGKFFKHLIKNFNDAEIYYAIEKGDGSRKDIKDYKDRFLIKLNDDFIIYRNEIYYIGDIENADKRLNEAVGTFENALDAIGAEKLTKGIKDFLNGKFTDESKYIVAKTLQNMLFLTGADNVKNGIKNVNIYRDFLETLKLKSISELTPIKAFYLFSQGEKLTGENLEKLKDLDINKLKDLYIAQLTNTGQYLVNPVSDKKIKVLKLIQSDNIDDYAKNSKFFTYTFKDKYDIYNKNPLIYKSILYTGIKVKC